MKSDWEYGIGYDFSTWALPLQFSYSARDFGRRWGIGIRILCFTAYWAKDYRYNRIGNSINTRESHLSL